MKRTLGFVGTLICTVGLLALPAAAQDRGTHRNNNQQQYGSAVASSSYSQYRSAGYADSYIGQSASYMPRNERYFTNGREHVRDSRLVRDRHEGRDFRGDDRDCR